MTSLLSNNSVNSTGPLLNLSVSRKITFAFLISLVFPSLIYSFIVLYYIIRKKQIRNRLNNHLFLCLFLLYFVQAIGDLPLAIVYYYRGHVAIDSDNLCKYWFILTGFCNTSSCQLNAYLSIERYLLIFHNQFLLKYKLFLHYIPMIALYVIPFLYMNYVINLVSCENHWSYDAWACGSPCYLFDAFLGTFSWVYAILAPLVIMIFSNILLIARVIYLKQRMVRRNVWRKNKKMIFQLFSLTGVMYISWMPSCITSVISYIKPTPILTELYANWMLIPFIYVAVLCAPLTCTMAIPELREEVFIWVSRWKQHQSSVRMAPTTPVRIRAR